MKNNKGDFSSIARIYEKYAKVQSKAAEFLLELLELKGSEDILDLGCGSGKLTRKLRSLTTGKVIGVDPSEGMIREAQEKSKGLDIIFKIAFSENIDFKEEFDIIFCNSAFQWFSDPKKALKNIYRALRSGGKIGIQAPAKKVYSPNFVKAVEDAVKNPYIENIFSHFRSPWFFLESEEEYSSLFKEVGFRILYSKIITIMTKYTPDQVFNIFLSGAQAGYLNQNYYDIELPEDYPKLFLHFIRGAFEKQSNKDGIIPLKFHRVFLVAEKSD